MTDKVLLTQTERIIEEVAKGTVVVTGMIGPSGVTTITNASDVDKTELSDGAVLVYRSSTSQWIITKNLSKQVIDGGSY